MANRVIKAKLLLSLALLRELLNKIRYYKGVIEKNIEKYREYVSKVSRIVPKRAKVVNRELEVLEMFKLQLSRLEVFLEAIILRVETLVSSENLIVAVKVLQTIVDELKKSLPYSVPFMSVIVDKLDAIVRDIVAGSKLLASSTGAGVVSEEVRKIVDEAKKVVGKER
ncbi:MAG TPA: hypothetical protein EYH02_05185 [Ignisphaera aggregans]|uniref:Uncharacterized protein n=1 Tax=Ignisphaera aggregans TaxID=334771 RepID=A0A833DTN3_9CREN|nr:hypothetical protein [Ignisphaera aggregans]